MKLKTNTILWIAIITALLSSCRDDVVVVYPTHDPTGDTSGGEYAGLYVLNEGNMGSNKCTLDYLDLATGVYSRNIYPSRNPNQVMELGDVGNDIKIYGSSLWMVVNMSNKVEVANASTAISRGHVDIPNCRSLAFDGRYAYVSSYVGEINAESVVGGVYKVDTTTLQVVGKVNVGYQPDELDLASPTPDFRNLLQWQPAVLTDENGVAEIPFAASDVNTEFIGIAEAVDGMGLIGCQTFIFRVIKQ